MGMKSDLVMCKECAHFRRGSGSAMALGRCRGKPWDGHEGQWPFKKHPCRGFEAEPGERAADGEPANRTDMRERRFYLDALKSVTCACGRPKRQGMAFCIRCFNSFPRDLRARLWKRMGEGFEEAYDEALRRPA